MIQEESSTLKTVGELQISDTFVDAAKVHRGEAAAQPPRPKRWLVVVPTHDYCEVGAASVNVWLGLVEGLTCEDARQAGRAFAVAQAQTTVAWMVDDERFFTGDDFEPVTARLESNGFTVGEPVVIEVSNEIHSGEIQEFQSNF